MNELSNLIRPRGAIRRKVRVGRGQASGLGKTAGRGGKGQKARTGNMHFEGFEGGQSPLQRRLPKRGFSNNTKVSFEVINIELFAQSSPNSVLTLEELILRGLVKSRDSRVKILGFGDLRVPLVVHAHKFTASARSKIESAGGSVVVVASI